MMPGGQAMHSGPIEPIHLNPFVKGQSHPHSLIRPNEQFVLLSSLMQGSRIYTIPFDTLYLFNLYPKTTLVSSLPIQESWQSSRMANPVFIHLEVITKASNQLMHTVRNQNHPQPQSSSTSNPMPVPSRMMFQPVLANILAAPT